MKFRTPQYFIENQGFIDINQCFDKKNLRYTEVKAVFGLTDNLFSTTLSLRASATSEAICQVRVRFLFNFSRIFSYY